MKIIFKDSGRRELNGRRVDVREKIREGETAGQGMWDNTCISGSRLLYERSVCMER